jgi:hypothetical protein
LTVKKQLVILAPLVAAIGGAAFAQNLTLTRQCQLSYKDSVNAKGTCTVRQTGDTVTVSGTVEENGQKYVAIITNSKNEGLLMGAGTFTLADGRLASNQPDSVRWPNGYVLSFNVR